MVALVGTGGVSALATGLVAWPGGAPDSQAGARSQGGLSGSDGDVDAERPPSEQVLPGEDANPPTEHAEGAVHSPEHERAPYDPRETGPVVNEFMQMAVDADYAGACAMLTEDGLSEIDAYDASDCEQLLPDAIGLLPGHTAELMTTASYHMSVPPYPNSDGEEVVDLGADGFPMEGEDSDGSFYFQHGHFRLIRKAEGWKIDDFPAGE